MRVGALEPTAQFMATLETMTAAGSEEGMNDAVEKVTGQRVPFAFGPRREGDPPSLVADSSRLQAELGWAPRDSGIERIVETAWAWFNRDKG